MAGGTIAETCRTRRTTVDDIMERLRAEIAYGTDPMAVCILMREAADLIARLRGADGWQLVPKEPTEKMLERGWNQVDFDRPKYASGKEPWDALPAGNGSTMKQDIADAYRAMLAAAPPASHATAVRNLK